MDEFFYQKDELLYQEVNRQVEAELSKMLFDKPYLDLNKPKNRSRIGFLVSVLLANEKERRCLLKRIEDPYTNRN